MAKRDEYHGSGEPNITEEADMGDLHLASIDEWPVCLARGRELSRRRIERRLTTQPWCRSMVIPERGPSIFEDRLKIRSNHKLPRCPRTT
ncbi:hypothetical protein YC2023_117223 [Brassica napus]